MKGEITLKILEAARNMPILLEELAIVCLTSYGATVGKVRRRLSRFERDRIIKKISHDERRRFYAMMYQLRRQGLVECRSEEEEDGEVRKLVALTARGESRREELLGKSHSSLPEARYGSQPAEELKIVAFDIPERERRKRDWLRETMLRLGFSMVQKSVWAGRVKLPEDFFDDMRELEILPNVEVFAVSREGTLTKMES